MSDGGQTTSACKLSFRDLMAPVESELLGGIGTGAGGGSASLGGSGRTMSRGRNGEENSSTSSSTSVVGACRESKPFLTASAVLGPVLEGYPPDSSVKLDSVKVAFSWKKLLMRSGKMKDSESKMREAEVKFLLLSLAAPLASIPKQVSLPRPTTPELTQGQRTTREVIKRYIAATGGYSLHHDPQSTCVAGHLTMWVSELISGGRKLHSLAFPAPDAPRGRFTLWQSPPGSWYVEVALADGSVITACDGAMVWRHNWAGYHEARGPIRPLRRALEGLDPPTVADVFSSGEFNGEEVVDGEECVCIKIMANPLALMAMSSGPSGVGNERLTENMCDVLVFQLEGFFSKQSGLLIGIRDHQLTKSKTPDGEIIYWERIMLTRMEDFRLVEGGALIAHKARSMLLLCKECDNDEASSMQACVREMWTVDEVLHNRSNRQPTSFAPPPELIRQPASSSASFPMRL